MKIFIISFFITISYQLSTQSLVAFDIFYDINVINPSLHSISSTKVLSSINCLVLCNLNIDCLTVVYFPSDNFVPNCFLYSKFFTHPEKIFFNGSKLFENSIVKEFSCLVY